MAEEYRAKVFKSGNSVALRLPKDLGLKEGTEVLLREERGEFAFKPVEQPKRKFNINKVWGSATNLQLIESDDRIFEERPLWSPDAAG